jgi:hypothetical protein
MSRRGSGPGKRRGGPWYGEFRERLTFERGARAIFPSLKSTLLRGAGGYSAAVDVDVPGYESRRVTILFDRSHMRTPRVVADGPSDSKHRFEDGSLCMWYPWDPPDRRWVWEDGLAALIGHAIRHLFQEAWWRETGHWPGEEASHGPPSPKPVPPKDIDAQRG